jgi:uncharacterized membrane protein YkvA (DUF1232 family)
MATLTEKGARIAKNSIFTYFLKRAAKVVGKPARMALVLKEAVDTLKDHDNPKSGVHQVVGLGLTLIRLVTAWVQGHYRGISPMTIVSAVAVLLYVVSPIDLVPDFIPVFGFSDDLALIAWFVGRFRDEIAKFQAWERAGQQPDALVK